MNIKRLVFQPHGSKFFAMGIEDTTYEIEIAGDELYAVVGSMEGGIRDDAEFSDLESAINWLNTRHAKIILEWVVPDFPLIPFVQDDPHSSGYKAPLTDTTN